MADAEAIPPQEAQALNSVNNSPEASAAALPELEDQEHHEDSLTPHSPTITPATRREATETSDDEGIRTVASAFEGPSSPSPAHVTVSPAHVLEHPTSSATSGPAIHEEPAGVDYKRMSKDDVAKLSRSQLRNSLTEMSPDDYKAFQKKMTEAQQRVAEDFFREVDEDTGIATTHQQSPVPQFQQPLRPPARTGPNKLRKNPPPGYVPPDYTEYNSLVAGAPRPGQGIYSRSIELRAAKNKARGELFPRAGATLDVATSPTVFGLAAKKTIKDVKEAGSNFLSKLNRPGTGGADEGNS